MDVGKRIKNLKKKIRQIEELEDRAKAGGDINQGERQSQGSEREGGGGQGEDTVLTPREAEESHATNP